MPSGAAFAKLRNERLIREIERDIAKWASTLHVSITHVTLTFNTRLGGADESMIEYVVVHELCHLIYADHSARFWALVASCLPDCKQRQIALNRMDMTPKVP